MNWRMGLAALAVMATSGVGAGFLKSEAIPTGYVPLRIAAAVLTAILAISIVRPLLGLFVRNVSVIVFIAWSFLTIIWSSDRMSTLSTVFGFGVIAVLGAALVVLGRRYDVVAGLMWLFAGISVASVALALLAPAVGTVNVKHPTAGWIVQPIGLFAWNSDLAFSAVIGGVIALSLMFTRRRWWLGVVFVFQAFTVWYSDSVATLAVFGVAVLAVLLMQGKKFIIAIAGVVILFVGGGILTMGYDRFTSFLFGLVNRSSSLTGRVNLWAATLEQWQAHPVQGAGAGVEPNLVSLTTAIHSHNGYIQILFDRGLVGLLILFVIIVVVMARAIVLRDSLTVGIVSAVLFANVANNYFTYASLGLMLLLWRSYSMVRGEPERRAFDAIHRPNGRVWVSAEVREEIEEILAMLSTSSRRWSEVRIDAPAQVLDGMKLPSMNGAARVISVPYSHATEISAAAKLKGLASFAGRLVRHRPQVLISGFSMMKHRLVSGMTAIPHIAYIRGVVFDASVSVGISDRLKFGGLSRFVPRRAVTTYAADSLLTVGEINKRFLIDRGNDPQSVFVCGPVWLASASASAPIGADVGGGAGFAYFVTGAWEAHGMLEEHEAQLELTKDLARNWSGNQRFALRVHPRDRYEYETDPDFSGVEIDRQLPSEFLASMGPDDLLISPLSTLAFEAMFLGRGVVFYADPQATKAYFHVYERLGIETASPADLVSGKFAVTTALEADVMSDIDFSAFDSAVDFAEREYVALPHQMDQPLRA